MKSNTTSATIAAGATVALVALVPIVAATPALADDGTYSGETYCGTVYNGTSPADDPWGAFEDTSNDFYDSLFKRAGVPRELCGPYHWLIEQGASWVVKKNVSPWVSRTLDQMGSSDAGTTQSLPATIPAVGPSSTPNTVSWTNGLGLWLRGGPGGSSGKLTVMPEGTVLTVMCQTRGEVISSGVTTTDLWDKVEYNGTVGYASDAYIDTGSNGQVAPTC